MKKLLAGLLALTLVAGPALAQNQIPAIQGPGGPIMAQPVINIGYDSATGLPCVVGKVATCSLQGSGGGGGGGGAVTAVSGAFVANSIVDLTTLNSKIDTLNTNVAGPTTAGSNIIGKISQVDSGGADATDTTNHAVKVNIVAGASSGAVAQGSTTSGQTGGLTQAAVTTAAPTYTTAQTSPLSLNTAGGLRVDGSGVTQPVSGAVTLGAGSALAGKFSIDQTTPGTTNTVADNCFYSNGTYSSITASTWGKVQCGQKGILQVQLTSELGSASTIIAPADGTGTAGGLAVWSEGALRGASSWNNTRDMTAANTTAGTGVAAVEFAGTPFANITTATTTTVKSGAGTFHRIVINTPVASETITVYDSLTGSGTKIATLTLPSTITGDMPTTVTYDLAFATGLTIVTSSTADITVTDR
jgi:hypothetical protein